MVKFLPPTYVVPIRHSPSPPRVYDDNALVLPRAVGKKILFEVEGATLDLKCKDDILKLFPHRYNWTFSPLKEWESFFRFFTKDQLFALTKEHKLSIGEYQLDWIVGTDKMRLTYGGNTRTTKYLTNLAPWVVKPFPISTAEALQDIVDKYIWTNKYIPMNPTSPASTGKDLLLDGRNKEFIISNKLPIVDLRFLHSCYIGPRMESRYLGTIDSVDNLDLIKAYLRALGTCPSTSPDNVLKVERDGPFDDDAHPGSGYDIEVNVPQVYSTFAPIPYKHDGNIYYPVGKFRTQVSKPYLDLLNELGDIPYTIIHSVQILLVKKVYPFKELSSKIEQFEDLCRDSLYPLNLKNLHYSLHGHMLHMHKNYEDNKPIWYETSQDYHPINAGAIQSMVACKLWRDAVANETEAIRVDALTGYSLPDAAGYKREGSGLMTSLTSVLKDKPGSTMYRDLIYTYRDFPGVRISFPMRLGVRDSWTVPSRIGSLQNEVILIPPSPGSRRQTEDIRRVGELLDRRIGLDIPHVEKLPHDNGHNGLGWVEEYLRIYPQGGTCPTL